MNLITAMNGIGIGRGKTPLDYLRDTRWDDTFAQDRFFGYIDPAMITAVVAAAGDGEFAEEKNPGAFHPAATLSYKQVEYDYSNVQLTFHQNAADLKVVDGLECVMFEPDMDLYKELLPNLLTHGLTDPVDILSLRWLDTTDANPETTDKPGQADDPVAPKLELLRFSTVMYRASQLAFSTCRSVPAQGARLWAAS